MLNVILYGPAKAVFGRLNEKNHTPVANLVCTGVVGLIAIFLDVATSTSFISFGAFTAFSLVNAPVVFHYVRRRRAAIICAYLLSQLGGNAITRWVCPGWCWACWFWR